jgi:hypothetical protein
LHGSEVIPVHEVVCSQEYLEGPIFPHRPIGINTIHINGTVVVSKPCGAGVGYASQGEEGDRRSSWEKFFRLGKFASPLLDCGQRWWVRVTGIADDVLGIFVRFQSLP